MRSEFVGEPDGAYSLDAYGREHGVSLARGSTRCKVASQTRSVNPRSFEIIRVDGEWGGHLKVPLFVLALREPGEAL